MSRKQWARLIVCEPSPHWAVLLRRFGDGLEIGEARSLALAEDMLREHPASCLAVAVDWSCATNVLLRLSQWRRDYPAAAFAVLLPDPRLDLDLGFREAGAQLVIDCLFDLPPLVRMARRHLEQVNPPELEWREAIAARMPW